MSTSCNNFLMLASRFINGLKILTFSLGMISLYTLNEVYFVSIVGFEVIAVFAASTAVK